MYSGILFVLGQGFHASAPIILQTDLGQLFLSLVFFAAVMEAKSANMWKKNLFCI